MRLLVFAFVLYLAQVASPAKFLLEGRVLKAGTGDPVPSASIVVARVGGTLEDYRASVTDSSGRFSFTDLTAGTYRVFATRTGYLRAEYGSPGGRAGTGITLDARQSRVDVTLSMTPFGIIAGRVRDGNGRPLRHVWVRALRSTYRDGSRRLTMAGFAETNDLGEYRIFDLQPGRYFVSATMDGPRIDGDSYNAPAIPVQISPSDRGYQTRVRIPGTKAIADGLVSAAAFDRDISFPTYYPNTKSEADAVAVEVRGGLTMLLADLTLARTRTVHVRGRVVNGITGEPLANLLVSIPPLQNVRSGASGLFDIPGVPAGQYDLWSDAYPLPLMGLTKIEVANRDLDDVTLILRPALTVTGRLTIDGRSPGDAAERFSVQLQSPPGLGANCCSAVRVQPDGSFTVDRVGAVDHRFRVIGRNFFVRDARFGATDALTSPLPVSTDSVRQRFMIDISLNTGSVEVRVLDRNQQPLSNVFVVLVPAPPRRSRSDLYVSALSTTSGTALLENVAPGDYKIFASQDIQPQDWQDPAIVNDYESLGIPIQMTEKAKRQVTVRPLSLQP